MILAFCASLFPAWIGSFMLENLKDAQSLFETSTGIVILSLFALSFWGTSWAYIYLKHIKYAILSGLGKLLLVVIGVLIHKNLSQGAENFHPYIIFLGILLAFIWGIIDFALIYYTAKKTNLDSK